VNKQLPSLHLLKLFEAAARHHSFKLAAEELHLTPSAVSHQIKTLEEQLGFPVFRRMNRKIELTAGGELYYEVVADAFTRLHQGTYEVLHQFTKSHIKISIMPSLARHFLIPRLSQLKKQIPGVEISIETDTDLSNLQNSDIDIAIRFGQGNWPDLICKKMTDVHFSPMCSPTLAKKLHLTSPNDLINAPLINYSFMPDAWLTIARMMKLDGLYPNSGLTFDDYDMAIQAAKQDLGIVLGLEEIEYSHLKSNTLVMPFDVHLPVRESIYLVHRHFKNTPLEISEFIDWFSHQLSVNFMN
jgi:LysR family glycine cleavage system transcriptional activator